MRPALLAWILFGGLASAPVGAASAPAAGWPGANVYFDRAAAELVDAARRGRPETLAHLHRLANLQRLHPAPDRWRAALEAVQRAPRTPALARDHARVLDAARRGEAGDATGRDLALDEVGLIRAAWLAGPFANAAGAGHGTRYPPESGGGADAPMRAAGRAVGWRHVDGLAVDGRWRLATLLGAEAEGTAYLAAQVEVAKTTPSILRIGATDAVRVWVDGQEILQAERDQFAALDQLAAPVRLKKGRHHLLVKVSWRDRPGELLVRWTRPRGGRVPGLVVRPELGVLPAAATGTETGMGNGTAPAPRPDLSPLSGLPPPDRASPEQLALRADLVAVLGLYDARARPSPPEALLRRAVQARPERSTWRFLLAHRTGARDPGAALSELRALVAADPNHAPGRLALAEAARSQGRWLAARTELDAAVRADQSFEAARIARAELGFDILEEGPIALARMVAVEKAPSVARRWAEARMRRSLDDVDGARRALGSLLEAAPTHAGALDLAADLALADGDPAAAVGYLERAARARPWRWAPRRRWVDALLAGQRPEEARRVLAEARARFPHAAPLHTLAADIALEAGDRAGALAALDAAQAADPRATDIAARRRALVGPAQDEWHRRFRVEPDRLRDLSVRPAERASGAAVLSVRDVVRLREDGRSVHYVQRVLRVQRAGLAAALGTVRIPYVPSREQVEVLAAERLRPDGRRLPPSRVLDEGPDGKVAGMYVDQREQLVVFDELAPGDLVHVEYRIDPVGPDIFGGFFGHVFAAQEVLPVLDYEAWVLTPQALATSPAQISAPPPEIGVEGETRRMVWRLRDLEPLALEPLGPPYPQLGVLLSVSSYPDWAALARWYAPLYRQQLTLDDDARAAGRAAVAGATDPREIVRRLYTHVVTHTRYVGIELGIHGWQPFTAAEVHRRGYGDCKDKSTLLVALLAAHGVEAHLTLVRTRDRGHLPPDHATMWAFNHAIVHVPALDLFLDPTAEFHGTQALPALDQGAQALVVEADRARPVVLPAGAAEANRNVATYTATLAADTRLTLSGEERFTGQAAAALRRALQAPDERRRYLEDSLGDDFPGAEVQSATFSDVANREVGVRYAYRVAVPRYGRREADRISLPVALFQHRVTDAYASLDARRTAVHVRHPWQTTNRVAYRLPAGAQVKLPESIRVDSEYVSLTQSIRRTEDGFTTEDTVTLRRATIPAEDYAAFREACLAIDRALARRVEVRLP